MRGRKLTSYSLTRQTRFAGGAPRRCTGRCGAHNASVVIRIDRRWRERLGFFSSVSAAVTAGRREFLKHRHVLRKRPSMSTSTNTERSRMWRNDFPEVRPPQSGAGDATRLSLGSRAYDRHGPWSPCRVFFLIPSLKHLSDGILKSTRRPGLLSGSGCSDCDRSCKIRLDGLSQLD